MKYAVYTIAKNEEKHVERWYESAKDADYVLIADTGSEDSTVEIARSLGINVIEFSVDPWRFDTARNKALQALPDDIDFCISMDMDEVIESGDVRAELDRALAEGCTILGHPFIFTRHPDGSVAYEFEAVRIHARHGYEWRHAIHEVIYANGIAESRGRVKITLEHKPDHTKSRAQYLPLLKQATLDDPSNARDSFYYGRELMYYKKYDECRAELTRYLDLPGAVWKVDRAKAMRYIASCVQGSERFAWLSAATRELPDMRECWVDLAQFHYERNEWPQCYVAATTAINEGRDALEYHKEPFAWGATPYDLASISAYWIDKKDEAIMYAEQALDIEPNNERIRKNLIFYKEL
jgi:glycosyltransferase involved in cell wall biosynthesis